jgi:hypothetical protein
MTCGKYPAVRQHSTFGELPDPDRAVRAAAVVGNNHRVDPQSCTFCDGYTPDFLVLIYLFQLLFSSVSLILYYFIWSPFLIAYPAFPSRHPERWPHMHHSLVYFPPHSVETFLSIPIILSPWVTAILLDVDWRTNSLVSLRTRILLGLHL